MSFLKKLTGIDPKSMPKIDEPIKTAPEVSPAPAVNSASTHPSIKDLELKMASAKAKTRAKPKQAVTAPTAPPPKKRFALWQAQGELMVDVFITDDEELCIQAPIAGVNAQDIDIAVENDMLVIKGERKKPTRDKIKKEFFQECFWGAFARQIILPDNADPSNISASFDNGILTIRLPLIKDEKKKVVVEVE